MQTFKYVQPKSLSDAAGISEKEGDAAVLFAGGTDVLGLIKNDIISPSEVINLKSIPGLNNIEYSDGAGLKIGALTTVNEIAEHPVIMEKFTVLSEAAKEVASPQLRNVGTIGGNICQRPRCWYFREEFDCIRKGGDLCYAIGGENKYHCVVGGGPCYIVHPSDIAVALVALNAEFTITNGKDIRKIPADKFFVLPGQNSIQENILKPGEILTEIFIPDLPSNTGSRYIKFTERDVWDFAIVSVAAVVNKSGNKINSAKIVFGGVAPVPWTDENFNSTLIGMELSDQSIETATGNILEEAEPMKKNEYKIPLTRNLVKKILKKLHEST
ncbi:FAD binding domain-containing protein [Bacteroidota bacterium]